MTETTPARTRAGGSGNGWSPRDLSIVMVSATACLCLVILVAGTVIGVINQQISTDMLGTVEGVGVGGGLLGFGVILWQIIRVALRDGDAADD